MILIVVAFVLGIVSLSLSIFNFIQTRKIKKSLRGYQRRTVYF